MQIENQLRITIKPPLTQAHHKTELPSLIGPFSEISSSYSETDMPFRFWVDGRPRHCPVIERIWTPKNKYVLCNRPLIDPGCQSIGRAETWKILSDPDDEQITKFLERKGGVDLRDMGKMMDVRAEIGLRWGLQSDAFCGSGLDYLVRFVEGFLAFIKTSGLVLWLKLHRRRSADVDWTKAIINGGTFTELHKLNSHTDRGIFSWIMK